MRGRKFFKFSNPETTRNFVVFEYLFDLFKIYRDLERNGVQNAICAPGVKRVLQIYSNRWRRVFNYKKANLTSILQKIIKSFY